MFPSPDRPLPVVAIVGQRGVGRSTLVNSLRGLRPGDQEAAKVGADEMLTPEQRSAIGNLYRCGDVMLQDLPPWGGNELDLDLDREFIRRFKVDMAHSVLWVYNSVLTVRALRCARCLQEKGVPVFFVRNKVDLDCECEVEDGNATSEEEALERMRERAYDQMVDWGFFEFADEQRLFLIGARYAHAVQPDPPRFDFPALKEALAAGRIAEKASRAMEQRQHEEVESRSRGSRCEICGLCG